MKLLARLRAILFLSLVFSVVVVIGFWVILGSAIFHRPQWMRFMCRGYSRLIFPLFGIRVEQEGMEHLDPDKRYLFVSNHQSFLDIMTMMGWLRFPAFLAKKEIASWPLFGWSMRQLGCVFVDRKNRRDRMETPRRVREALGMGVDFCIFPEGTRSADGQILPFQSGAFHIATEGHLTLVPVALDGSGSILNKKGFRMFSGTIRLATLPPIDLAAEECDHKELARRVETSISTQLAAWRMGGNRALD